MTVRNMSLYEKNGISLMYPENWEFTEEGSTPPFQIALESPSGGMWILHIDIANADGDELVKNAQESMEAQYESIEWTSAENSIGSQSLVGFDGVFYSLDFLVTAKIRITTTDQFTFLLLTQSESREYEQIEPVFNAITTSLLTPLPRMTS